LSVDVKFFQRLSKALTFRGLMFLEGNRWAYVVVDCKWSLILAMAIVGRAKYTHTHEISRRHKARGAPKGRGELPSHHDSLKFCARMFVFACPTITIAKIRLLAV